MIYEEDFDDSITQYKSYSVTENYDWICSNQIVEYWLPTTNHKQVMIHRKMGGPAHLPQIGSWQSFELQGKKIERRVRKIVYNTKSRVYKVYIDYTHNHKRPIEYKKIENTISVTFAETTDLSVYKFLEQWKEMIQIPENQRIDGPHLIDFDSGISFSNTIPPTEITINYDKGPHT